MEKSEIIELVKRRLRALDLKGITIDVIEQGVRNDENWWYVPVHAEREPKKAHEYYEVLTEVEDDLKSKEKLDVLLVPSA